MKKNAFALIFFLLPFLNFAQPANDACGNAVFLEDISEWCSGNEVFTTINAAPTTGMGTCSFSNNSGDVWFSFVPLATEITVVVSGGSIPAIQFPALALYSGNCDNLVQVACVPSPGNLFINSLSFDDLDLGETYYLQVLGSTEGNFRLCIQNYNAPFEPGSDCPDATSICNRDAFVVQSVDGPGNDPSEANDANCLYIVFGIDVESFSTWFNWTAASNGTFTFVLTPLNATDDLDFVVYELPNGADNCNGKIPIRCMASSCIGQTGLDESSTDTSEPPNCGLPTQDNFLAAINMSAGESYALMVNNFSQTGIGFQIEFGGTAELAGPDAAIAVLPNSAVCEGTNLTFQEVTAITDDQIVSWEWDFGPGATPSSASTPGPHSVSYDSPGFKPVLLELTTEKGCVISEIITVEILCCDVFFENDVLLEQPTCFGSSNGSAQVVINETGNFTFSWSNGSTTDTATGLSAGIYKVTVSNEDACRMVLTIVLDEPDPIDLSTQVEMASCDGGMDGSVAVNAQGGVTPYLYSWEGSAFSVQNTWDNLGIGSYEVRVRDDQGCENTFLIEVTELELILDPQVQAVLPPSCVGYSDAAITVSIANGLAPFLFDFNDGQGYVNANLLTQLPAGIYQVDVLDANNCEGHFSFLVEDPTPLAVDFVETPITCYGLSDGGLLALPSGGTGAYTYEWGNGATTAAVDQLGAGTYTFNLSDGNGCLLATQVELMQPDSLRLDVVKIIDLLCYGDPSGELDLKAVGGVPPYLYRLDEGTVQSSPFFENLYAGIYQAFVQDANGCENSLELHIQQPEAITVFAGEDRIVELGDEIILQALVHPSDLMINWSPSPGFSCMDCPNPRFLPIESDIYTLTVEDMNGCKAQDSLEIQVKKVRPVFIPNAVSPNDDGRNDVFSIYGGKSVDKIASVKVFDRWGALLYDNEGGSEGWNGTFKGKKLPVGVYTYLIEVIFIDGEKLLYTGDVSILR
ncbi:MAG TPA: gliding motility-associated C-terminal domain-containing protein [Saprospiraceae bacterium]|nr:gliding motility-associated C-terminal domain-containing protein [Saprospiraceae bacterium]HMQ82800.1 gliding motility-associated C-terminal domain-containing protein [Saprospiraceae bacterium]